jgi:hypothetical protein
MPDHGLASEDWHPIRHTIHKRGLRSQSPSKENIHASKKIKMEADLRDESNSTGGPNLDRGYNRIEHVDGRYGF